MYASKDRVRVVVVTNLYRIEGELHVLAGSRLSDSLNSKSKDFLAMTDAKVYRVDGEDALYSPSYLVVNRASIDAVFPLE